MAASQAQGVQRGREEAQTPGPKPAPVFPGYTHQHFTIRRALLYSLLFQEHDKIAKVRSLLARASSNNPPANKKLREPEPCKGSSFISFEPHEIYGIPVPATATTLGCGSQEISSGFKKVGPRSQLQRDLARVNSENSHLKQFLDARGRQVEMLYDEIGLAMGAMTSRFQSFQQQFGLLVEDHVVLAKQAASNGQDAPNGDLPQTGFEPAQSMPPGNVCPELAEE